jgi:hypothetical protein
MLKIVLSIVNAIGALNYKGVTGSNGGTRFTSLTFS